MSKSERESIDHGQASLWEVFHANHSAQPEKERAQKMIATSGRKCLERFEKFDRATLWGKTFMASLIGQKDWYSSRCKLTWNLRGTRYGRLYFQLVPSTLPTEGIESGLLPTAQIQGLKVCDQNGKTQFMDLKMLPTPNARDWKGKSGHKNQFDLNREVKKLLPTPNASDNRNRGNPNDPCIQKRVQSGKQVGLTMMVDGQLNPPICSRNDGISTRLDGITFPKWRHESIKAYGNAIVPQVALQIFKAIAESEKNSQMIKSK